MHMCVDEETIGEISREREIYCTHRERERERERERIETLHTHPMTPMKESPKAT